MIRYTVEQIMANRLRLIGLKITTYEGGESAISRIVDITLSDEGFFEIHTEDGWIAGCCSKMFSVYNLGDDKLNFSMPYIGHAEIKLDGIVIE